MAGLGGFVILVFCLRLRLGFCLFLDQGFYQGLVFQCRLQVGLGFQGLFVGVDGRFEFTGPGQGVAAIVVGIGVITLGKPLDGLGIVAGLVQGDALPLGILEMFGGFGGAFLLEQVLALLVRTQPQILEFKGIAGLGRAQQQQR